MPSPNPKRAAYTINMDTKVLRSIDRAHQEDGPTIHSTSSHASLAGQGTRATEASDGARIWKCASAYPCVISTPAKNTNSALRGNTFARSVKGAEARTGRSSGVRNARARGWWCNDTCWRPGYSNRCRSNATIATVKGRRSNGHARCAAASEWCARWRRTR